MAGVKGDFRKLGALVDALSVSSAKRFRREALEACAETARTFILESFEKSRDPHGNRWKPSRDRKGNTKGVGQILRNTNRLMNSLRWSVRANGFSIDTSVAYAAVHNWGSARMPQRQFIPAATELPEKWVRAFRADIQATYRALLLEGL